MTEPGIARVASASATAADARNLLQRGAAKANRIADATLAEVHAAMGYLPPAHAPRACVTVDA